MRHEWVDFECQGWVLLDVPEWGPRNYYIARDKPEAAQYAVDDPEEENRSRILAEEIFRLAERPAAARIAALEAEVEAALRGQVEISESNGRMLDKLQEMDRRLREALAETTAALENFRFAPAFAHEPVILRAHALLKEE